MRSLRPLLLPLSLLAACSQNSPVQYRVPDLRILAIRATVDGTIDRADADPGTGPGTGESLTLDALVANPLGRASPSVSWFACAPPVKGSPCDPELIRDLDAFETTPGVYPLATGLSVPLSFSSTTPPTRLPDGLRTGVDVAMAFTVANTCLDPCDCFVELPVVAIVRSEGVAEAALKRLRLVPASLLGVPPPATKVAEYVVNHNPGFEAARPSVPWIRSNPTDVDACADGALLTDLAGSFPAGKGAVCAKPSTTPASSAVPEQYNQCKSTGVVTLPETPELQWYVTAGEIAGTDFSGNAEGENIELTPPAVPFSLWVIVRDGRGGTSWETFGF